MKTKQEKITSFLSEKTIAIAGASRNEKKFGYKVFKLLKNKGYQLFPVHPKATEIDNTPCFSSVQNISSPINAIYIVTPKTLTYSIVDEAIKKGIKKIWIQQASDTPETVVLLEKSDVEYLTGQCMFMHLDPQGIHAFHRWVVTLFQK